MDGKLPDGWAWTTISEIADVNQRNPELRLLPDDLPVSFVPMAAVDAEFGKITGPQIRPLRDVRKGFTPFSDGDVVFAKITPSMENGKAAIATNLENGLGFGSTEFHVLTPKLGVLPSYLFYFIRQESFRSDAKAHFAGTAGQLRVPSSFVENYPIPLPPLPEQERIVRRIESLFTRLDAGVAGLRRAQAALKRYRASVLKAACEGRLVEQDAEDEPAEGMLRRLGRTASAPTGLPDLPQGWCWVRVSDVCNLDAGFAFKSEEFLDSGIRLLRGDNIEPGRLRWADTRYWAENKIEPYTHLLIKEGDIILAMDRPLITAGLKIARAKSADLPCLLVQRMARFKSLNPETENYLFIALQTHDFVRHLFGKQTGTQLPHISGKTILSYKFPLPPLAEQHRIVAEVDRRLSVVQEVEAAVQADLARAARLRQAILKRAFEGRLA